jgi:regulation of enolase protein 1 (concanavalin A-like superfamily)
VITSPSSASGNVGSPFAYTIKATNSPTQFGAPSMPLWMSLDGSTGVITGTPPAAGTVTFTVSATNAYGTGQQSVTLIVTDTGAAWASQDIGGIGLPGSSTDDGATVTVSGSGADIWNTSDEFHFRYMPLSRDGELVARVTSMTVTNPWAKAGLMIRDSLAPDARYHWIGISGQNGSFAQTRPSVGAYTQITAPTWTTVFPTWLRIQRFGDQIYSYTSTDGVMWSFVAQWGAIDSTSTQYIGFAVTSHDDTRLCTAVFDNVRLTIASPAASPAAPTNITLTAPTPGQVTITWTDNSTNEGQFQILRSTDNVTFPVVGTTGPNVTSFEDTTVTGGTTYYYQVRAVNVYGASPYTGSLSITTPVGAVWELRDIGPVGVAGSNTSGADSIAVSGAGADVWGSQDSFRYVYRAVQGDVTVEAQVGSFAATQGWARAGVMIRESLDPTARNVFGFVTHDTLVAAQYRPTTPTILKAAYYDSRPQWIRLVKTAGRVSVQTSVNYSTWTEIAAYDFPLGQTFYVGFAVCSHDTSQLATAVFANPAVQ